MSLLDPVQSRVLSHLFSVQSTVFSAAAAR